MEIEKLLTPATNPITIQVGNSSKRFECLIHDKSYKNGSGYKKHMHIEHTELFCRCEFCDYVATSVNDFMEHIDNHLQDAAINIENNQHKQFICGLATCPIGASKLFDGDNYIEHVQQHCYSCPCCNLDCKSSDGLDKHLSFYQKDNLNESISKSHESNRRVCDICTVNKDKKIFSNYPHHMHTKHNKLLFGRCCTCSFQGKTFEELIEHLKNSNHSYQCPHCSMVCGDLKKLDKHMRAYSYQKLKKEWKEARQKHKQKKQKTTLGNS